MGLPKFSLRLPSCEWRQSFHPTNGPVLVRIQVLRSLHSSPGSLIMSIIGTKPENPHFITFPLGWTKWQRHSKKMSQQSNNWLKTGINVQMIFEKDVLDNIALCFNKHLKNNISLSFCRVYFQHWIKQRMRKDRNNPRSIPWALVKMITFRAISVTRSKEKDK